MNIEIININKENVVLIGGNQYLGYRGRFECPLVSGEAVIVPYSGREEKLAVGNVISVETDQETVSDFKVETAEVEPMIEALSTPGDYKVRGIVVLNSDNVVFDIEVGNFSFAVDNKDTGNLIPKVGDLVSFNIHGLSLWDENTL